LDVTLVTEGTYPQVHGGVSTWCDQMIRGLNKHRFHVVSLTATGREAVVWELPDNVLDHVTVPIWTMVPASRRQAGKQQARSQVAMQAVWPSGRQEAESEADPEPGSADPRFGSVAQIGQAGHGAPGSQAGQVGQAGQIGGQPAEGRFSFGVGLGLGLGRYPSRRLDWWLERRAHWRPDWRRPGRRAGRAGQPPGCAPARALVAAALSGGPTATQEFEAALFELFLLAQRMDLGPVWRSGRLVRDTVELWAEYQHAQGDGPGRELPLSDAICALDLIEHALRPLAFHPVRADVTHAVSNGLAALVGLGAKWTHGTPLVLAEHGVYLRERYLALRLEPLGWPVKAILAAFTRRLCETGYRAADLITPCADFNQRWERRLGADPAKLRTVYNGVDPARFPPAGPEPQVPTLAFVGRIDPLKDLLTLIRAFALVREQVPEVRLRIYGAAPKGGEAYDAQCRALVQELAVADAVTFEGQCSAVAEAYAASHVVVLSSISEGFPFSVIEAMVCARPLVATEVGGVAEAVGPTGLVVPPRRPDEFARACVELLTDHPRRQALGRAARERALELFDIERAVAAFDEIYRDLAAEPEPEALELCKAVG
jgi:polysaccharide biosynthesis protein PelF